MNIVIKDKPKDPFSVSDRRNPIGGGKGDADRVTDLVKYRDRFPKSMGPKRRK